MRPERRRALRRAAPLGAIGAAVVVAVLVAGGPAREGPPLDPTVTGPVGTKALVDVLAELGVDVRLTSAPDRDDAVTLMLTDDLDEEAESALRRWVRDGGTLVVADPSSRFAPDVAGPASIGPLETTLARSCALPALAAVERVAVPGGVVYDDPGTGALGCFPRADAFWFVAQPTAAGTVIALGGPGVFTNAALGDADNGLLAAALLAPEGGGPVAFLRPAAPGAGDATLRQLVPERVWLALFQLLLAFGGVVVWRSRRLGAPVREPQPVQVAGSELVTAVGHLLQHTQARDQAARILRDDLRRELADRLGLPADSPAESVAAAAARRAGRRPDELQGLLSGGEPTSEAELVALADQLERARRAALSDPEPTKETLRVR